MVTDLTLRSTSFQPPTHKGPSENSLICCTPRSVKWLLRWISRLLLRGVRSWSLWLSMSQWIGIYEGVWAPFSRVWMTMRQSSRIRSPQTSLHLGQSSSFSRPSIGRPEAPLVQERNLKSCPRGALSTGLTEDNKRDSINSWQLCTPQTARSGTSHPTSIQHPIRQVYTYQPVKYPPDISQLHSPEICYCG